MIITASTSATRRPRRGRAVFLLLASALCLAILAATPALAEEDLTAEQEALAKKIEGKLIAPC